MLTSIHSVPGSRARFCTIHDRGNVWPDAMTSDHILPAFGPLSEGLLAGRLVATDTGWRAVETLAPGDMVLTFDHGMRKLVANTLATVSADPRYGTPWGMLVPAGALGNRRAITLLPSQLVLLDCDYAAARFGDPFILAPAGLLEGYKGITRTDLASGHSSHMLAFEDEEIVHADGSALLLCYAHRRQNRHMHPQTHPRITSAEAEAFRRSLLNDAPALSPTWVRAASGTVAHLH